MSEEIIGLLKTGIQLEKKGLREYLKFAKITKDRSGKNMFITLAHDEADHAEILEQQLDSYLRGGQGVEITINDSVVEKVISGISELVKKKGERGVDQISALKIALDLEDRAVNFYTEGLTKTENTALKNIFQKLVEMEEAHYKILKAELDAIEGNGFWFDVPEFNLENE